ncbi:hypothetical protein [Planococcus halotolerans]|uniref:DUF1541 domain-containing protein n=1 Tax=Planococcus halotolerans TaxID=2233542 RepID=A0A365L3P6_9BACL|nr:hypothetical protein [Planococcus halotolerans]QHJ70578.1 hypothetical protein DNR44_008155 [Planococcus halotolerans]RAZ79659.1 hypothetical protein DP120_08670 [Planococcus halotolerans]
MIKGKKFTVIALSLMLTTGFASSALANNGKGAGLAEAPGQSENFSKGITTLVDVAEKVSYDTIEETFSEITSVTSTPFSETIVGEPVVTVKSYEEKHPSKDWYKIVTETTTSIPTTTRVWEDTTTVTTHYSYETLVTITETTTTTSTHRGAPGSNGKHLSEVSVIDVTSVAGEKVLLGSEDTEVVTPGEVTETTTSSVSTKTLKSDWIK